MSIANDLEMLPEVAGFLNRGPLPSFVGGKPFPAASGKTVVTTDPDSGNKLTEIHDLDAAEVD